MSFSVHLFLGILLLLLVQVIAALPWLAALNWDWFRGLFRDSGQLARWGGGLVGGLLVVSAVLAVVGGIFQNPDTLEMTGRVYGSILQVQLSADLFVLVFGLMLLLWPKGGAVALAAFREGVRQPMFWLLAGLALLLMIVSPFIPYFTFGEDYKMVQELGFDTIVLFAILFSCLAASMSIADEIEGRTAVTLMSKPVSRRQFLLGKFVGILMAALAMTLLLGWFFDWLLIYKRWYERMDTITRWIQPTESEPLPQLFKAFLAHWSSAGVSYDIVRGALLWTVDSLDVLPGLVLGFCKVMVLLAIAVSLATRVPMVVNLATCVVVYLLGHLSPVLVSIAQRYQREAGGSTVAQMLDFMARLFDALLPGLDYFGVGLAVVSDTPPEVGPFLLYVGSVLAYGVIYTVVVLLFGLILFEDRDLA